MKIFLLPFLWILSVLYLMITKLKFFLYKSMILNQKRLPAKIICIGNISSGGTGKTTTAIYLSKMFLEKGYKVAIISRGYRKAKSKNQNKKYSVVSNGKQILIYPPESGDEPYMTAKNLIDVPVIVSDDRYVGGKAAIENFQSEIIISDDGFQHWQLYRDIDIVLIDCLSPFGNLLPLGLFRELPSALNRANIILLTNTNFISEEKLSEIIQTIRTHNKTSPVIKSIHKPLYLQPIYITSHLNSTKKIPLSYIKNKNIIALSGIGNAKSFELTLESLGANIVKKFHFRDHHWYTIDEIEKILAENILIITTEKDAVRLQHLNDKLNLKNILILKIQLEITENKELWEKFLFYSI